MFPFIEIGSLWVQVYSFGVTLALCFFLFLWNLERLSQRFGYSFSFFSGNIFFLFFSTFFFSRLFYIISKWSDMRFIKNPFEFFFMGDFHLSLFWAIFGFLLMLSLLAYREKSSMVRYIDGVVLSFFLVLVFWYIGAFLWWQVYGRETLFGIEIMYTHPYSPVPFQVPIFPLAIVYAIMSFMVLSILYILSLFIRVKGFIWYFWLIALSAMILIFEFFSGKQDILSLMTFFNVPQFCALILCLWSFYQLSLLFQRDSGEVFHHID